MGGAKSWVGKKTTAQQDDVIKERQSAVTINTFKKYTQGFIRCTFPPRHDRHANSSTYCRNFFMIFWSLNFPASLFIRTGGWKPNCRKLGCSRWRSQKQKSIDPRATLLDNFNEHSGNRGESNGCWVFVGRHVAVGQQVAQLLVVQCIFVLLSKNTKKHDAHKEQWCN